MKYIKKAEEKSEKAFNKLEKLGLLNAQSDDDKKLVKVIIDNTILSCIKEIFGNKI